MKVSRRVDHRSFTSSFAFQKKLETRDYATPDEFATDVRLIFSNCYLYNGPNTDVVAMCKKVEQMFENKFAKLPDEPPMTHLDIDPSPAPATAARNNGPLSSSVTTAARKHSRRPSKNHSSTSGTTSALAPALGTSSDENGSSGDESSVEDVQTSDENTLRQLRTLQDQVSDCPCEPRRHCSFRS